jgi:hypothetical protein
MDGQAERRETWLHITIITSCPGSHRSNSCCAARAGAPVCAWRRCGVGILPMSASPPCTRCVQADGRGPGPLPRARRHQRRRNVRKVDRRVLCPLPAVEAAAWTEAFAADDRSRPAAAALRCKRWPSRQTSVAAPANSPALTCRRSASSMARSAVMVGFIHRERGLCRSGSGTGSSRRGASPGHGCGRAHHRARGSRCPRGTPARRTRRSASAGSRCVERKTPQCAPGRRSGAGPVVSGRDDQPVYKHWCSWMPPP